MSEVYKTENIKSYIPECRESGNALPVAVCPKLPPNCTTFLHVDSTETRLFNFLACKLYSFHPQSDASKLEL